MPIIEKIKRNPQLEEINERITNTLSEALGNLGLNMNYLILLLKIYGHKIELSKQGQIDASQMGASTWFVVCELLCISVDSISTGYDIRRHLVAVGDSIRCGEFILPFTHEVKEIYRNYYLETRRRQLDGLKYLAGDLIEKTLRQRQGERINFRMSRRYNKSKLEEFRGKAKEVKKLCQICLSL